MRVQAYAKINLTLEILGRRIDGYHQVKTILQTIDLADRLDFEPAVRLRLDCDDPTLNGEANLVWQAAVLLARQAGIEPRARIFLRKRIPVGFGLGGGSSDAAAALLALNQLWNTGRSLDQLYAIAAQLGSDVPFFLRGGTALAEGRGERVNPLPGLPEMPVLLVCPDDTFDAKTGRLYSRITQAHYSDGGVTRRLVQTLMGGQLEASMLYNVFENVAFQAFPGLSDLYQRVADLVVSPPHLSGAGPALFCLPSGEEEYRQVTKALQYCKANTYLVRAIIPRPAEGELTNSG
jgi:4-diphosphocytidyl-2-C-methyl-D-erythritol kinase